MWPVSYRQSRRRAVRPGLNGVVGRRTKEWIEVQIRSPKRHSAETLMPAYNLSPGDLDGLIEYLTVMPAQ